MKRILLAALLALPIAAHAELSPLLGTMNADNVTLYPGLQTYPAGPFHPMGAIFTTSATASTATGTGAQILGTYSLPANALDVTGRRLRISAAISTAANTNTKTCVLAFGAESVTTPAMATSAENAMLSLDVVKSGASTQIVWGSGHANATPIAVYTAAGAETDTAAIVIKVTCTDGTSSARDATLQDLHVEYIN